MLGELIVESRGKRIVRRTLSVNPLKMEVSFEDAGKVLGVDYTGIGTYTAEVRAGGSLHGGGQGAYIAGDGIVTWDGTGLGQIKPGGAVSYRGILFFHTTSEKLARMNAVAGVFEYEVNADGTTTSKVWEWK